jgi:hypothetical protein
VDRIGIRGYIPGLQYEGGVVRFLLERGNNIPSPAALTATGSAWWPNSTP